MPLKLTKRNGVFYIRGTLRLGDARRTVYETTGVGVRDTNAKNRANAALARKTAQILDELENGPESQITWRQAAVGYGERRRRRLTQENPRFDPAGQDGDMTRVADLTDFLTDRNKADQPLKELTKEDLNAYFEQRHFARGNKLATAKRDESAYLAVMNFAASQGWVGRDYPRADLGDHDPLKKPVVGKYFEPEEIRWMIEEAPAHFRPIVALGFASGRRTSDLAWLARPGRYDERKHSGELRTVPGFEHLFLGFTKNGEPKVVALPDWVIPILRAHLDGREDRHDELFLTDKGRPYVRPKRQRGGVFKRAYNNLKARLAKELIIRARQAPVRSQERRHLIERAHAVRRSTPHWFRHNAASHLFMRGASEAQAMEQLGWNDHRMTKRYRHMSPEFAKRTANLLDFTVVEGGAKSVREKKDAS